MVPNNKELLSSSPPKNQIIREGSKECPGAPRKPVNNSRHSLHDDDECIAIRLFPAREGKVVQKEEKEEEEEKEDGRGGNKKVKTAKQQKRR